MVSAGLSFLRVVRGGLEFGDARLRLRLFLGARPFGGMVVVVIVVSEPGYGKEVGCTESGS